MTDLMPVDNDKAQKLNEKLSNTLFKNIDTFIEYYNAGLINRRHDDNRELAREITNNYKNIVERRNRLVFISPKEILLREVIATLAPWDMLVKAKYEISEALGNGVVVDDTVVAIDNEGYLNKVVTDEDGKRVLEQLEGDRIVKLNDEIRPLVKYSSLSKKKDDELNAYIFAARDLNSIDDEFVYKLAEIVL